MKNIDVGWGLIKQQYNNTPIQRHFFNYIKMLQLLRFTKKIHSIGGL